MYSVKKRLIFVGAVVILGFFASCPAPLSNRKDVKEFIEAGLSIVKIRTVSFSSGGSTATLIPSGSNVNVDLDIINPAELNVQYTISCSLDSSCFLAPAPCNPVPISCTRLSFSFIAACAAEHQDLVFTIGMYSPDTKRSFEPITVSVRCDSPPNPVRAIDMAFNTSNRAFTAFRLPSEVSDSDLAGVEITYGRADGTAAPKTVTLGPYDAALLSIADPNILQDTDPRNRYFQPTDIASGVPYRFFVTLIDAAGQRSSAVDTASVNVGATKTPVFVTPPGLYETADSTMNVSIRCDTSGSTIHWRYAGGVFAEAPANPCTLSVDRTRIIEAYATKPGLAHSATETGAFELKCLAPDIQKDDADPTNTRVTIMGRTNGAALRWRYDTEPASAFRSIAAPDASSVASILISPAESRPVVAICEKPDWTASNVSVTDYQLKCAPPTVSLAGGLYTLADGTSTTVVCATSDSTLYWRYVAEPDSAYRAFAANPGTVSIPESAALVFRARKTALLDSDEVGRTYTLKCQPPSFTTDAPGSYYNLTIAKNTANGSINYLKTGDTTPTVVASGTTVPISAPTTVTAWQTRTGWTESDRVSQTCEQAASPIFTANPVITSCRFSLATATPGGAIQYRLGAGSYQNYAGEIELGAATVVYAFATKPGLIPSPVASMTFTQVATPTFTINADGSACRFTISTTTDSSEIYYRVDSGTYQTYAADLQLDAPATVSAYAVKAGWVPSATASRTFEKVATPTISVVASGASGLLTLSSATPSAAFHYKLGSGAYQAYTGPTPLASGALVTAYATRAGFIPSDVATETFEQVTASVTLSPSSFSGVYTGGSTYPITADCGTPGVTIGWSHSAGGSGTVSPGGTISINKSGTLTVTATKPGYVPSAPTTGVYTFTPGTPTINSIWNIVTGESVVAPGGTFRVNVETPVFQLQASIVYQYSLDGGPWIEGTPINAYHFYVLISTDMGLIEGNHTMVIRGRDSATNLCSASSGTKFFRIDSTPPAVSGLTINGASITGTYSGTVTIRAGTNDYCWIYIDGSKPSGTGGVSSTTTQATFDTTSYADGIHTITVQDFAGHPCSDSWAFVIDNP